MPIADTPGKAVITGDAREALRGLVLDREFKLAVISGRSLKDIKKMVGLKGIVYSGNHGLEVCGPGIKSRSFVPQGSRGLVKRIGRDLRRKLAGIKGVILEDKGYTLSVHYRMVRREEVPRLKKIFHETTAHYLAGCRIKTGTGKMVVEVKPAVDWDKGKLVMWLLARQQSVPGSGKPVLPIYIGDDTTDEDAFTALGKRGMTVFVGKPGKTKAGYYLKDHKEVVRFLGSIGRMKKE